MKCKKGEGREWNAEVGCEEEKSNGERDEEGYAKKDQVKSAIRGK